METTTLTGAQILAFVLLIVWSMVWKGFALWASARNNDKAWFIVLLLVNSLGILEMFYLFIFSKRSKKQDLQTTQ